MGVCLGGGGVVEVGVRSGLETGGVGEGRGVRDCVCSGRPPSPTNTGEQRQINMHFRHFCSYGRKRQHCRHFAVENKDS